MKKRDLPALLMAALLLAGCAAYPWDPAIQKQEPSASKSPREAPLQSMRMVRPHAGMAKERAQWWGLWQGWIGPERATDVKVVFSHITDDKAFIQYSWADAKQSNSVLAWAEFKDGFVEGRSRSIGVVQMRLRESGNVMEVRLLELYELGGAGITYGVLTRQPPPDKEFLTNN